ncbi:glutamate receptor-like [Haliotis rufescens]|uniref:glutamate receptor-like n=1 Tax=Haliotis rufescens TaxID=6454 RepID=UPI00201E9462|nr:glutamate receptor-like [Haliotis rufescens]
MSVISQHVIFINSYKYIEPPDGLWGEVEENGSWTGIVGMLQREEADLCSVPYAMNIERAKVMEFTYPILTEYSTVIYKKMDDKNKTWKVLISCFKWEVYIVGGIVLLIIGLMYGCLIKSTPNPCKEVEIMRKSVYYNGITMAISPPLCEATVDVPVFDSGRMLFSCWWLFCLIMTAIYRCNLMTFLTVSRTVVPFSSLEELANQDVFDVGAPVGSYVSLAIEHDNARPHTARLTQNFLANANIHVLPWPACSPDMNPIEHMWEILGRKVRNRPVPPVDFQELEQCLLQEWQHIPANVIRRLTSSARRRVLACIDAHGGHTRY